MVIAVTSLRGSVGNVILEKCHNAVRPSSECAFWKCHQSMTSRALFPLCSCGTESVSHDSGNHASFKTILPELAGPKTSTHSAARLGMSSGPSPSFWRKTTLTVMVVETPSNL